MIAARFSLGLLVFIVGGLGCRTTDVGREGAEPSVAKVKEEKPRRGREKPPEPPACPDFKREDVVNIAILPQVQQVSQGLGVDPYSLINKEFTKILLQKGYKVVTRNLVALSAELKLPASSLVDPATAARLGKIAGASHVILVNVPVFSPRAGRCDISVDGQIIEVETGSVKCQCEASQEGTDFVFQPPFSPPIVAKPIPELTKVLKEAAGKIP